MIKKYKSGKCILVKGPAKVEIIQGKVEIFGKTITQTKSKGKDEETAISSEGADNVVIISTGVRYPFFILEDSELEIYINNQENITELDGNSIPDSWIKVANEVIEEVKKSKSTKPEIIMVLGLSSGKTTIIKYLANKLFENGFNGGYLDSDLGQQSCYIPTTVNMGIVDRYILSAQEFSAKDTRFIGSTFPKADLKYILPYYSKELIDIFIKNEKKAKYILIDTDGWIKTETGVHYKTFFVEKILPDHVIIFRDEEAEELKQIEKIISKLDSKPKIYPIKDSNENFFERSKEERRFLRQRQFALVFEKFRKITIPFNNIPLVKEEYDLENDEIVEVKLDYRELDKLPYHYVIIGLKTENNELINIGLLFSINLEKKYFLLYSDMTYKEQIQISKMTIGSLRLSTKGNYQGYLYL